RYEVAAMVARAVAAGDAKHASKKDVELLKKLCVEFKDELAALGAKTDKLDKRVTKLEKGIGSWQISGRFKFYANFANGDYADANKSAWVGTGNKGFNRDTARMFFRRQITEDTYFDSQFRLGSGWSTANPDDGKGEGSTFSTRKFYVGTKLPFWGLEVKIGRSQFDWEGDYGLYADEDALIGDWRMDGFWFTKKWNKVKLDAVIGRNSSGGKRFYYENQNKNDHMLYSLNLKWTPTDKLTLGGMAYWMAGDNGFWTDATKEADGFWTSHGSVHTYGVTAGYKFADGIALKGVYYWQKIMQPTNDLDENQYAFKVILDVKQNVLKFTDLWVEYAQMKNGFGGNNGANNGVNCYSMGSFSTEPSVFYSRPVNNEVSKIWHIQLNQKWNKKWSTFLRGTFANWSTDGQDNAKEYGLGVKYKLNPAITFMLAYDVIDYGDNNTYAGAFSKKVMEGKDNVLMFQTDVKF
ncbi:MAG: S-layer homology domain-containing protein, partial [Synergistaceae bacterium]|nr:S-layer homology domain-containing protein [Candidatus Equadaptatus faecalis]